jgi:hypothetical protein
MILLENFWRGYSRMQVLVLLALVIFTLWYFSTPRSFYSGGQSGTAVPETIIQDLATAVRREDQNLFPVETIFVNSNPDGSLTARMLFINLRGFFGVQNDILGRIDSGKVSIISKNETIPPSMECAFQPYRPDVYTPYKYVKTAVLETLKGVNQ